MPRFMEQFTAERDNIVPPGCRLEYLKRKWLRLSALKGWTIKD